MMKINLLLGFLLIFLGSCGTISKIDYQGQIKGVDIMKTFLEIPEEVTLISKNNKESVVFPAGIYSPYRIVNKSLFVWYISPIKIKYHNVSLFNKIMTFSSKPREVYGGFLIMNGDSPKIVETWLSDHQGNFDFREKENDLEKIKYNLLY